MMSLCNQYDVIVAMVTSVTSLALEHGRQCMLCSIKFSMALQTEIFSIETFFSNK